jgi:hypothetical protein
VSNARADGDEQGTCPFEPAQDLTVHVDRIIKAIGELPISKEDREWLASVVVGLAQRYLSR